MKSISGRRWTSNRIRKRISFRRITEFVTTLRQTKILLTFYRPKKKKKRRKIRPFRNLTITYVRGVNFFFYMYLSRHCWWPLSIKNEWNSKVNVQMGDQLAWTTSITHSSQVKFSRTKFWKSKYTVMECKQNTNTSDGKKLMWRREMQK